MFKRRDPHSFFSRLRHILWPKSGWSRALQYAGKRTLRIKASPHAIACGFAAGVFASFTPFVGLHTALAIAVSWPLGGSFIAAFLGTFAGNPLTFPLIWATTHRIGTWVLGRPGSREPDLTGGIFERSFDALLPLIKPMVVGGVPLGLLAALVSYFPIRYIVATYQARRAERQLQRRQKAHGDLA